MEKEAKQPRIKQIKIKLTSPTFSQRLIAVDRGEVVKKAINLRRKIFQKIQSSSK